MAILWGFAEVTPTKVTIMAEIAEKAEDIDVGRAQAAVEKAEERLKAGGVPSEVKEA
ncbi:MAG: ATP synthase epsilon chain [Nitrospira sp.]|nr:ATP synthase epsilon chain [Nitrospira sp.]